MRYKDKRNTKIHEGINVHELHRNMRAYNMIMKARCLFLWNFMSKMKFTEEPTKLDIKHLEDIKQSLADVFLISPHRAHVFSIGIL